MPAFHEENVALPSLSVRKLSRETYERLRVRAAQRGTSMEEEARRIIALAVSAPQRLGDLFVDTFGPDNGVELPALPGDEHDPLDLGS